MVDIKQLATLNKAFSKSYNQQKQFIKKVMSGKTSTCPVCKQTLIVCLPGEGDSPGISCNKGCTDILLDFD